MNCDMVVWWSWPIKYVTAARMRCYLIALRCDWLIYSRITTVLTSKAWSLTSLTICSHLCWIFPDFYLNSSPLLSRYRTNFHTCNIAQCLCLNIAQCKKKGTKEVISFFTIPEYQKWALENNKNNQWEPKYFKVSGCQSTIATRRYWLTRHVTI